MATTSFGYKDSVDTKLSLQIPTLSYGSDFAVTRESAGEVILTNVTSPLDQPETLRMAIQGIGNVYNRTNIALENRSVSQRGVQLLSQVNDVFRVNPDDVGGCCTHPFDLPIGGHTVLYVPLSQYVTADIVLEVLKRLTASFFDGSVDSLRLNEMLRGALKPSGM